MKNIKKEKKKLKNGCQRNGQIPFKKKTKKVNIQIKKYHKGPVVNTSRILYGFDPFGIDPFLKLKFKKKNGDKN